MAFVKKLKRLILEKYVFYPFSFFGYPNKCNIVVTGKALVIFFSAIISVSYANLFIKVDIAEK